MNSKKEQKNEKNNDTASKRRNYLLRKKNFALLFIFLLLAFSTYNVVSKWQIFVDEFKDEYNDVRYGDESINEVIHDLEDTLEDNLTFRMEMIEIFSYFQKVLGKREVNNFAYIKDEKGSLHYASFYREDETDGFEYAMRVKRLKESIKGEDANVLFVVTPGKYSADYDYLIDDMPVNDPTTIVNETLFYMNRLGIDTLDMRDMFDDSDLSYEEAFFKTDHHWTVPAAFESTVILADTLNEKYDMQLETSYYLDEKNYTKVVFKDAMFGSMGRKTGANYVGLEDMVAYYPNFEMNFVRDSIKQDGEALHLEGDIIGTLILTDYLAENNIYKSTRYEQYLNTITQYESITNLDNPEGKRILMIRDSYYSPVIAFLAPMVGQIDAVWSLEEEDDVDVEAMLKNGDYDCVIIEMYPYNIKDEAFNFFVLDEEN